MLSGGNYEEEGPDGILKPAKYDQEWRRLERPGPDNRLAHLLTYTTFHIGVYISLVTALIGAGIFEPELGESLLIRYSITCIVLAGMCGGIVGSNIPDHFDFNSYANAKIGFWLTEIFNSGGSYRTWIRLEHLFFWLGVLPLALVFIRYGGDGVSILNSVLEGLEFRLGSPS